MSTAKRPHRGCVNLSALDLFLMESLMTVTSRMCSPTILPNSPGSIYLPELADGKKPFGSLDGPKKEESGQPASPASHSVWEDRWMDLMIQGTSGRRDSGSSASIRLQSYLESRLKMQSAWDGSTVYFSIWRKRVTPAGRLFCAQTVLEHPTDAKGSIGLLPTPTAREGRDWSRMEVLAKLDNGSGVAKRICNLWPESRSCKQIVGLNPSFALWMMGFRAEWSDAMRRVTPLFPKSRRSSSVPAPKPLPT